MATLTPFEVISHTRKVCSLYKRMSRNELHWCVDRALWRYHTTVLRAEFEKHRNIKDMARAQALLQQGEDELEKYRHYKPFVFADAPGGTAYNRHAYVPDSALDFWDPVEKAFYPKYFAKREQRKKEYIELWEKKYGKVKPEDSQKHH